MVQRVTHNFIAQALALKVRAELKSTYYSSSPLGFDIREVRLNVAAGCCRKDEKTMQILTMREKKKLQFPAVFYVRATTKDIAVEDNRRQSIEQRRFFFLERYFER